MKKRICLFAGYDKDGIIQDYVIYYIKELSKLCDVYYYGDFDTTNEELTKLDGLVKGSYATRHKKYDFGSWQELINIIGWENIQKYDELIITNDSCYAPLFPLENFVNKMNLLNSDFWGASSGYVKNVHIQSYFICFKKSILKTDLLKVFFEKIEEQPNGWAVVEHYEDTLTKYLELHGFKYSTYIPYGDFKLHPYYETWNCINHKKFPFLKVKAFSNEFSTTVGIRNWKNFIQKQTQYDSQLIQKNLLSKGISIKESESFTQRNKNLDDRFYHKINLKRIIKKLIFPITNKFNIKFFSIEYKLELLRQQYELINQKLDDINKKLDKDNK